MYGFTCPYNNAVVYRGLSEEQMQRLWKLKRFTAKDAKSAKEPLDKNSSLGVLAFFAHFRLYDFEFTDYSNPNLLLAVTPSQSSGRNGTPGNPSLL